MEAGLQARVAPLKSRLHVEIVRSSELRLSKPSELSEALEVDAMKTQISPMLAVSDASAAIAFYQAAFGATLLWHLDHAIAGLSIDGAQFFLAVESPPHGTRSPASVNFTTVRIELFVDDPAAVCKQALAAGAIEHSPVEEHTHTTVGPHPISRMLQGAVLDPFGHLWLVGKILE